MRGLSLFLRRVLVPLHLLCFAISRASEYLERPRYVIRGSCLRCGHCCRHLMIVERPFLSNAWLQRLSRWWLERIYPFVITGNCIEYEEPGELYRILHCRNYQHGGCAEYALRPQLCREWPLANNAQPPVLFAGCGYYAIDRRGDPDEDVSVRRLPAPENYSGTLVQRWQQRRSSIADE